MGEAGENISLRNSKFLLKKLKEEKTSTGVISM